MLYPRNTCCKLGQNSTLISHMGGIICCRPVGAWHEVGLQSLPRESEPSPTRREHPRWHHNHGVTLPPLSFSSGSSVWDAYISRLWVPVPSSLRICNVGGSKVLAHVPKLTMHTKMETELQAWHTPHSPTCTGPLRRDLEAGSSSSFSLCLSIKNENK